MWEGGLLSPLNNKIKFTSLELCISKIVGNLLFITLSFSVDTKTQ